MAQLVGALFCRPAFVFIAYLIISSIQLGATVDYAILMGSRYQEERRQKERAQALVDTVGITSVSIMTPAAILAVAGFMIGFSCTNASIAQLGILLGRGALISCLLVLLVLPACLYSFDRLMVKKKKEYKKGVERSMKHKKRKGLALLLTACLLLTIVPAQAQPEKYAQRGSCVCQSAQ